MRVGHTGGIVESPNLAADSALDRPGIAFNPKNKQFLIAHDKKVGTSHAVMGTAMIHDPNGGK